MVILACCMPALADEDQAADTNYLNRVTVSARFGFNMSAKFHGMPTLPQPTTTRFTPHGDRYNYDDGYVLKDISGNAGGQTWYWGYDNSANQISGNNILLSRSTVMGGSPEQDVKSDPSYGAEIVYHHQFLAQETRQFGLELAANFQSLRLSGSSSGIGNVARTTDAYPYTSGTTPPGSPYQGSYEGPGFVISDSPVSSTTTYVPGGASVSTSQHLDADVWGFRLGPYMEFPVADQWNLSLSGGLSVGVINPSVSWNQTISITGGSTGSFSGSDSDTSLLWGGYLAATVTWQLSERWSIAGGLQYQHLQNYEHSFAGQNVEINLQNSIFVTFGVGFSF